MAVARGSAGTYIVDWLRAMVECLRARPARLSRWTARESLLRNAPWLAGLAAFGYCTDVYRYSHTLPWDTMAGLVTFEVIMAIVCGGAAILAMRTKTTGPAVECVAVVLFLVTAFHGPARLIVALDHEAFGSIAVVTGFAGFALPSLIAYLVIATIGVTGAYVAVPYFGTQRAHDALGIVIVIAFVGLAISFGRKFWQYRIDCLESEDERLSNELRATVVRLEEEVRVRHASEENLRASEERYRTMFENSIVGVFRCRPDGSVVMANPALAKMLGYESVAELVTPTLGVEGDRLGTHNLAHCLQNTLESGRLDGGEHVLTRRDGSPLVIALHARRLIGLNGTVAGYEGLAVDISGQREAEESLRQHREKLTHISRLASLGEMLAAIAHEVNQPLHAIANFAGASLNLIDSSSGPATGTLRHWNHCIAEQATRAGEIIQRLRGFAHKTAPTRVPVSLDEVIEESLGLVHGLLNRHRVEVQVCDDGAELVLADPILIEQVLTNLFRNACEAMTGEDSRRRRLTIYTTRRDNLAEIVVSDTGVGLREADLQTIFEPFVSTKPEGLGLGLAICRSIVEAHGGRMWAMAAEDQGASFHFTLPIVDAA